MSNLERAQILVAGWRATEKCDLIPDEVEDIAALLAAAVSAERERCATVAAAFCTSEADCHMVPDRLDLQCDGCRIAAAIRKGEE